MELTVAKDLSLAPAAIGTMAEEALSSAAPQSLSASNTPTVCPTCRTTLLPGAVACLECGYLVNTETGVEPEGTPTPCVNPACGAVNSSKDRICQRCGAPLPASPGTILHGRYRIERQLALGGFGAVYLATDLRDGKRPVAVKDMICSDPQEFAIRLNFFRREAEILRSLQNNPIVPRIFDFIQQGQTAHLIMELIKGQDLLKIMDNNGNCPFPLDQVIDWGRSICDVLVHMHSQLPPLVHRDLKPDNIMLLDDRSAIKLIDFGTARDLGRTQRTRMAAKTRVYTEGYAPPKQIICMTEPRTHLIALPGTLYHLATGKPPEGSYTARELEKLLNSDPTSPNEDQLNIPETQRWFFQLIQINLAEDANDRYFSAREFKADLENRHITREMICPKCRTSNKVREPYCLKCAEPLTDPTPPCTHCGKVNRMGSRCCIYCGNRLR
jgi:serine/threonine protein kinase